MTKHKKIGWAVALTGALYYGLLIYWQSDELAGSGLKEMPIIGRYGKLLGWLTFATIAVWYVRPSAWGGYDEGVGFFLVGILLLGFGAAAILTSFMWEGEASSRLYALKRFVDVYPTITKP
ncbi:MAG: hypothetical protein VW270_06595, partial [Candidatus Poseidoniales archaeon]